MKDQFKSALNRVNADEALINKTVNFIQQTQMPDHGKNVGKRSFISASMKQIAIAAGMIFVITCGSLSIYAYQTTGSLNPVIPIQKLIGSVSDGASQVMGHHEKTEKENIPKMDDQEIQEEPLRGNQENTDEHADEDDLMLEDDRTHSKEHEKDEESYKVDQEDAEDETEDEFGDDQEKMDQPDEESNELSIKDNDKSDADINDDSEDGRQSADDSETEED
jgi:hypothetical protein